MPEVADNPSIPFQLLPPKHLQQILDAIAHIPGGHAIICLDTQYRYLYFNENHEIGMKDAWNADIEIGRSPLDYISIQEDHRLAKATLDRMLAGETIGDAQSYGSNRSSYKSDYRLLRDEQDNIIGIFIVSTDITERQRLKKMQEETRKALENQVTLRTSELQQANRRLQKEIAERRQIEEALRASEERFRNTFEQSTSTILLLDRHLNIRQTNRAFTDLTGYLPEEAVGRPLAPLLGINEKAFDDFGQISPLEEGRGWKNDFLIQAKSGREIEVSIAIAGLFNSSHQLVEYIATLRDITLRRELEKAQQQFMHSISHEMRTPLTNLILYIDLLKKNPLKVDYLNILAQQVNRLQVLVSGVLEITSLTLSRGTASWSNYRLPGVVNAALKPNRYIAERAGITLNIAEIPSNLPAMTGDPVRLGQALSEIIKNALSYSPKGETVAVTVGAEQIDGSQWATITISDNGSGIPYEELNYIFEDFYRGQEVERNNIAGAGLGLPIAQVIIKAHGGRITVKSDPGQGSTFTVWLPSIQAIIGAANSGQ